jgi:hypothetical protein
MAWRMLKPFYEPQNSTRKLMLNHKLYNIKMNEGTSKNDFITDIRDVVTQLASIKKVIQEECWAPFFIAMNHLSRDFSPKMNSQVLKILLESYYWTKLREGLGPEKGRMKY